MSKASIVTLLGIIIVLIPIDGLPDRISTALSIVCGALVIVLGLLMRVERLWLIRAQRGDYKTDAFQENGTPQKIETL